MKMHSLFLWFISVSFGLGSVAATAQSIDSLRVRSDSIPAAHPADPATTLTQTSSPDALILTTPAQPASGKPKFERPSKAKLIVETDQRFYYPIDTRNAKNRPAAVNYWGARAGLLFPAGFKAGFGYYFSKQNLRRTDLFPDAYTDSERRLTYFTGYYEPYFFRRKFWELSSPLEVGYGMSRYKLEAPDQTTQTLKGTFIPVIVGVSVSGKLPPVRGLKALRWFGLNFVTGYRFTAKKDFPNTPINYNGFYYSVSPVIFLDRITDDLKQWVRRHQARKHIN